MKISSSIYPARCLAAFTMAVIPIASSVASAGTSYTWNPTAGNAAYSWVDTTTTGWNAASYPGSGGDLTAGIVPVQNDTANMYSKDRTGNQTIRMNGVNAFLSELDIGDSTTLSPVS